MKIYFGTALLTLFILVTFGIILPALFSAASTEAVILGITIVILAPLTFFYIIKKIFKTTKGENK